MTDGAHEAARVERRWATISVGIILLLVVMAAYGGLHWAVMPQAQVEIANPRTLHIAGEFIESNLGAEVEPDGSVLVRAVGQQYSFTPQCIVVPVDTPITIRATSADVVHGFLVQNTNVNVMLVPGYVSTIAARFDTVSDHAMPCHEFCGIGHEGMWGRIRAVSKADFAKLAADRRRVDCVTQ